MEALASEGSGPREPNIPSVNDSLLWTLSHLFAGISATLYGLHLLFGPHPTRLYPYLGRFSLCIGLATLVKALSWLEPADWSFYKALYRALLALVPVLAATATEFMVARHLSTAWKWTLLLASLLLPLWALSGRAIAVWDFGLMVYLMATFAEVSRQFALAARRGQNEVRQKVYRLLALMAGLAPLFVASDSLYLVVDGFPRLTCLPILFSIFIFSHGLHKSDEQRFHWVGRKLLGASLVSLVGAGSVLFGLSQPLAQINLVWWTFMLLYLTVEPLRLFHHHHRRAQENLIMGRLLSLQHASEQQFFQQLANWPEIVTASLVELDDDFDREGIADYFSLMGPVVEVSELFTVSSRSEGLIQEQLLHLLGRHKLQMLVQLPQAHQFLGLRFEVGHDLTNAKHLAGLLASTVSVIRARES